MYHRPVCKKCETELKPEKNDIRLVDTFQDPPQPCKIWSADLWKCPGCGYEVVVGFGQGAIMEHWEDGFAGYLERCQRGTVIYNTERRCMNGKAFEDK